MQKGIIVTQQEALALHNKMQTRISRPCRDQTAKTYEYVTGRPMYPHGSKKYTGWAKDCGMEAFWLPTKPPYNVADEIYVKETWRLFDAGVECGCHMECDCYRYHGKPIYKADSDDNESNWHPSVHMTQDLARTFLRIKSGKAMQVQDISEKEAIEHGIESMNGNYRDFLNPDVMGFCWKTPFVPFKDYWNLRYKKKGLGWDSNCWMWSWEVERIEC